jgi:hypothetical protein
LLAVEVLRADAEGELEKVGQRRTRQVAPGETLVETETLPPPGTTLRYALRARVKKQSSAWAQATALRVLLPLPTPTNLKAELSLAGVALSWTPPADIPIPPPPPPPPAPVATPSPSPSPTATPAGESPETVLASPDATLPEGAPASPEATPASPEAAPAASPSPIDVQATAPTAPLASPTPEATPTPVATPVPTPPPPPRPAFRIYRRGRAGEYGQPLATAPVPASSYEDTTAPLGEAVCYVVRTLISTEPVMESAPSEEACVEVKDVAAPAAPTGVAMFVHEDGSVELSWSPSPEADLASYRVYRVRRVGEPQRLAELAATESSYVDRSEGARRYALTAVDQAGNESPFSEPVEERGR